MSCQCRCQKTFEIRATLQYSAIEELKTSGPEHLPAPMHSSIRLTWQSLGAVHRDRRGGRGMAIFRTCRANSDTV